MTETVDVMTAVRAVSTPQPLHKLSPTAIPASRNICALRRNMCAPRRLFQPKKQNVSASAELGSDGLELGREAVVVAAAVVTVNVADATVPDGVTGVGENVHEAPAGNPAQLKETAEANPFSGATRTVVVPLCPAGMLREVGERAMEKLGARPSTM
jgi:hypothetical protein